MATKTQQQKQNQEEDFQAIRKVLDGDHAAYDFLQKKYKRIIAALIRKMVQNEDDVDDLTQESFIKAYNALASFQFGYSFSAWLYRIASNTCIDFLRKKRFPTISIDKPIGNSEDNHFFEIEDKTYMPDDSVLSKEKLEALREAIENLPENYREIIKLRHEKEMDYKNIAEMLDLPLGTVKAHLFRARKLLLEELRKKIYLFKD